MVSLKEQRIGVFVDVQNMYYSAKHLYNSKVNFANILKTVVDGRKLIRALAYVIKTEAMTEKSFHEALEKIGFEIRAKDLQIFYGGAKKGDWDVGISMDIIESAPKLDVIIIVSGDGDFVPALQHARSSGCIVEAAAFGRSASSMLKNEVTKFYDLDGQKDQYLIKSSSRKSPVRKSTSGRKKSSSAGSSNTSSSSSKKSSPKTKPKSSSTSGSSSAGSSKSSAGSGAATVDKTKEAPKPPQL